MRQKKIDSLLTELRSQLSAVEREMHFRAREIDILRWIDQQILNSESTAFLSREKNIYDLFHYVMGKINSDLLPNGSCCFYVNMDNRFVLLDHSKSNRSFVAEIKCRTSKIDWRDVEANPLSMKGDGSVFSRVFFERDHVYTEPLFIFEDTLLGVFVVVENELEGSSVQLADEDSVDTFRGIFAQLKIAYKFLVEYSRILELNNLWEVFAQQDLSPYVCFRILARRLIKLMPSFGPMKLVPPPEVQILIKKTNGFRIRASTGRARDTDVIPIGNSISGLSLNEDLWPRGVVCIDPTEIEFAPLYRSYFSTMRRKIRTELVVPIKFQKNLIGVLNLESFHISAFTAVQKRTLEDVAKNVAPIVLALEARLKQNRDVQTAYGSIMSSYLDGFAAVLGHGIATPISAVSTELDTVKNELLKSNNSSTLLLESLSRLNASFDSLRGTVNGFVDDLSAYGEIGPVDLCELIYESIGIVNDTKKTKLISSNDEMTEHFQIIFNPKISPTVKASKLLKPYLICLIDNSIRSIEEKQKDNKFWKPGIIRLTIEQDSKDGQQIVLKIRDNGLGVRKKELRDLSKFQFGTRYRRDIGQGYGLAATQRYLSTIDGWMEIESVFNRFFKVNLSFRLEKKIRTEE